MQTKYLYETKQFYMIVSFDELCNVNLGHQNKLYKIVWHEGDLVTQVWWTLWRTGYNSVRDLLDEQQRRETSRVHAKQLARQRRSRALHDHYRTEHKYVIYI